MIAARCAATVGRLSFAVLLALVLGAMNCKRHLGSHTVSARDGLYLRAEPTQEAESLKLMPRGAQLQVVEYDSFIPRCTQGECGYWAAVNFGGQNGFAFSGFMRPIEGLAESETPGFFIGAGLLLGLVMLSVVLWLKRNALREFLGRKIASGASSGSSIKSAGDSAHALTQKVRGESEQRSTERNAQLMEAASQARMDKLRAASIKYVQDTSSYRSSPLYGLSFSQIAMAIFALMIGCFLALNILTVISDISQRNIAEEYWLLVAYQLVGVVLSMGLCFSTFVLKAGFNVINIVQYYLFYRGIDLIIFFFLLRYPSELRRTIIAKYGIATVILEVLLAIGIYMLFALFFSRSKRVRIRYGQYLKFGDGNSILGIFPSVARVTEEEAAQLLGPTPVRTEDNSAPEYTELRDRPQLGK